MQRFWISFLFICYGIVAIIKPNSKSLLNNYQLSDLIRGWGISTLTLGFILLIPSYRVVILAVFFIAGIIWHLSIIKRFGQTNLHQNCIFINILGLFLLLI